MLRAVLDANVFISAALRPQGPPGRIIKSFLSSGPFEIVLSDAIIEEVLNAFRYPKLQKRLPQDFSGERWFDNIAVLADLVAGEYEITGISKDPDDDKYIAAAIEGRADFVVAGDSDLLSLKEYRGIRFVTPRAFLMLLPH